MASRTTTSKQQVAPGVRKTVGGHEEWLGSGTAANTGAATSINAMATKHRSRSFMGPPSRERGGPLALVLEATANEPAKGYRRGWRGRSAIRGSATGG